ncbi:MAG TPA: AzlD domain-containing protein, partial [Streptosporangiaceae bacterium]|nr:AzlD domain-containing protein [Streptosporangiaceae bacterium]
MLAVTAANWVMKASGPLALGERRLPPRAGQVISLMASALLAGLIITHLGGTGWSGLNCQQVLGVGTAGLARALKAPMLLAVACG